MSNLKAFTQYVLLSVLHCVFWKCKMQVYNLQHRDNENRRHSEIGNILF